MGNRLAENQASKRNGQAVRRPRLRAWLKRPAATWRHRFLAGNLGTTAIEFAIILPVLFVFLLGIMDTGRLLWTYSTISRAVEAAARCAAVNKTACGSTGDIQQKAVDEAWGLTIASAAFSVADQSCGKKVSASYDFPFFIPGFSAVKLNASACYAN